MKWIERQAKVEEFANEYLEDIAGELGVEVPFYPEVYWCGRRFLLGKLGLPKKDFEEINRRKEEFGRLISTYIPSKKILLINSYFREDIAEEVAHFLHLETSKLNLERNNCLDDFSVGVITEMFGFFGSKLVVPDRENIYSGKNIFPKRFSRKKIFKRIEEIMNPESDYDDYEIIHQEGYDLGDRLFYKYISKEIPVEKIREIFLDPLRLEGEPFLQFINLKYKVLK